MPFEDLEELHYIISIASKGVLSLTQAVITEEQLERIFRLAQGQLFKMPYKGMLELCFYSGEINGTGTFI